MKLLQHHPCACIGLCVLCSCTSLDGPLCHLTAYRLGCSWFFYGPILWTLDHTTKGLAEKVFWGIGLFVSEVACMFLIENASENVAIWLEVHLEATILPYDECAWAVSSSRFSLCSWEARKRIVFPINNRWCDMHKESEHKVLISNQTSKAHRLNESIEMWWLSLDVSSWV